jgi:hypothetical protein
MLLFVVCKHLLTNLWIFFYDGQSTPWKADIAGFREAQAGLFGQAE